ncbi:DNA-processing protein DprA [Pseudoruegeria sp. SHC-113]|uniref:DNA-processing protein DprA n=1 Tax=Pseudoruegeria sp. SHC-113 TaxID=2855439 RepID=UPI0021BA9323|nr:DNA-processing protein DprA [Pseudoruegeria sp. SHC-113]MCT8161356.1 DNA-processing protein DprA [Pseudoruegeria sp. SHC-113]
MPEDAASPHPPLTSPSGEGGRVSWLRLIRSHRVGVATFYRLLAEHGSAEAALEALPGVARAAGLSDYHPFSEAAARAECAAARAAGAQMILHTDPTYPPLLRELDDAPPLLWLRGDPTLLTRPAVALIGARNASSLGTRMARRLAAGLSEAGYVIVSGLARGIDAVAHAESLAGGTLAVFAGGADVIYPKENAALAADIAKRGAILSEMPMGLYPQARNFPRRNRIVSGLCRATVVVEAAARSGSLITARFAADQSREVMAVPGHPFDARASGCNMLLRDGATLVRGVEDVLEVIGPAHPPQGSLPLPDTAPNAAAPRIPHADLHRKILATLGPSPVAEDQLIRDLKLPAEAVGPELVTLELEGKIHRAPGGLISLS